MGRLKLAVVIAVILMFAMLVAGCGNPGGADVHASSNSNETQPLSSESKVKIVGEGSVTVSLSNTLGIGISSIELKSSAEESFGPDTSFSGLAIGEGETFELRFDPIGPVASDAGKGGLGIAPVTTYDLHVTTVDGKEYFLRQLALERFAEVADLALRHDDATDLAYLTFTESNGATASTLEAAKALASI